MRPRRDPAEPGLSSPLPDAARDSTALRTGGDPWPGRRDITQPIGSAARWAGKVRRAAAVPLSAHWTSSRQTSNGSLSAALSSRASRSCSSQYRCSGEAWVSLNAVRSRIGRSAFEQGLHQHRHLDHGVGRVSHTGTDANGQPPAIVATSAKRRLLPIPAAPSTRTIAPTPESSWSSCRPRMVRSPSRPRRVRRVARSVVRPASGPAPEGPFDSSGDARTSPWYGPTRLRPRCRRPGPAETVTPDPAPRSINPQRRRGAGPGGLRGLPCAGQPAR